MSYIWLVTRDEVRMYEVPFGKEAVETLVNELLLPNISDRAQKRPPIITVPTGGPSQPVYRADRQKNREIFLEKALKFYQRMLSPLQWEIRTTKLIIVPHGVLHKVPFAALSDGTQFLVDRYAISIAPSASVIPHIVRKRNGNQWRVMALVNPTTKYGVVALSEGELSRIRRYFPSRKVILEGGLLRGD